MSIELCYRCHRVGTVTHDDYGPLCEGCMAGLWDGPYPYDSTVRAHGERGDVGYVEDIERVGVGGLSFLAVAIPNSVRRASSPVCACSQPKREASLGGDGPSAVTRVAPQGRPGATVQGDDAGVIRVSTPAYSASRVAPPAAHLNNSQH